MVKQGRSSNGVERIRSDISQSVVSFSIPGCDRDHTEGGQNEAANLRQRVSELLWWPPLVCFMQSFFVFGASLTSISIIHTLIGLSHSPACLPNITAPHEKILEAYDLSLSSYLVLCLALVK